MPINHTSSELWRTEFMGCQRFFFWCSCIFLSSRAWENLIFLNSRINWSETIWHIFVPSRHRFPMGFVKADCELSAQRWQPKYMPGWNADWTTGAVASVETIDALCDEWVDHPVLVVQRDTFANFFHDRFVSLPVKTSLRIFQKFHAFSVHPSPNWFSLQRGFLQCVHRHGCIRMEGRRQSDLPHRPISQGTFLVNSKHGAQFTFMRYSLLMSVIFFLKLLWLSTDERVLNCCPAISIHLSVYRDMWSDVFSPKGKFTDIAEDKASTLTTMTAWDLRNTFGQKVSKHNSNKEVSE